MNKPALLLLTLALGAFGQRFDTSNTGALHGDYFVREILITGQSLSGDIVSASSAIGVATFNGSGSYTFAGASGKNSTGSYGVGANGLLYIQSIVDSTQYTYGGLSGIGPTAFVASATEGTSGDILVAIPAGNSVTAAALNGNYTAGYVSFPNSEVTQVREASFNFTANGAGVLSGVTVSGTALNLGGSATMQTISGATYTLAGEGSGTINLGAVSSSQVLSGSLNFYLSADGNVFLAGTPGGCDLIVGTRAFTGTASNNSWNQVYFTGALEDTVTGGTHRLDAFYGSWNATGQGVSIAHDRFQSLAQPQQVFDYTFDTQAPVQSNATSAPNDVPYQFTLGAGGHVFIGTGTHGLYSLLVGFAAPKYSGGGVYLNPLGVVNAANYAPITNPIAPGEIITLFGSGFSSGSVSASAVPLPTTLANVRVTINGQYAPIFFVTPGQISVIVPQAVSPDDGIENATIRVISNNVASNAVTVYTNRTAPGIFSLGGNGIGPAAAEHLNGSLVGPSNPATAGSTVVLYATGLGEVDPAVPDGAASPSSPLSVAADSDLDTVMLGKQQETVTFNGLTPGLAGLFQLNTGIVASTPAGTDFAGVATPDAITQETTLAVGTVSNSVIGMARLQPLKLKGGDSKARQGRPHRAPSSPKPF